ncbi:hypothetical protein B9T29_10485 [Acinetobacter sp. ANC 3903]|uniref:hypothetical protein n=1 Tax=Acinetobacter sp. ANC 3903 TaxID=1977883 RepID=UPI000A32E2F9|nr:hypothetical protein [Acinetobacter sp. ANC 3903]OTG61585.1 hypothetical protein B9T29_10485 [Acinetobacter sp. ANC 3903]
MDKYLVVAIVVIVCIGIVIYTQRADAGSTNRSFKDIVQKEFGKYKVIEKNQTIMICEINHRNELDELVFIRIDPNQKKNIRSFGRRVTFTYSKQPSVREMRQNFAQYLS